MIKNISLVGIAGAGTMGASMAETFAKHGYSVILFDISQEALKKAERLIRINQKTEVSENILSKEASEELLKKIEYTTELKKMTSVDMMIEAIVEKLDIKSKFWKEASSIVGKDTILATNTSGLSITTIAESVEIPERFLGMHWINPPHFIPLIELISGEKTNPSYISKVYELCEKIDKKPVKVKDAPGFVLNRIQLAILRECLHIADQGIASPEDIDKVMKYALGIRYACLGPFEIADHGGLDIFYNIASYLFEDLADHKEPFSLLAEAVSKGNHGVKTGIGIYDYSDGKDEEAILYRDKMYTTVSKCLFDK